MSSKAHIFRALAPLAVLFLALGLSTGEARASLGPAYNANFQRGACFEGTYGVRGYIYMYEPTQVADIPVQGGYHRATWTTLLWRAVNGQWTRAVAGRDYRKNPATGWHPGWAYLGGAFYPDAPYSAEEYTIITPGYYAVQGVVYYDVLRDSRVQDVGLTVTDGFNNYNVPGCWV
jgi:hypothetical protein